MPRFVIRITDELLAKVEELMTVSTENVFGDKKFALITVISETEMNFKLLSEDELVDEVTNDNTIQIVM